MLKSRSGSKGSSSATPPQTIEVVRRRARHRLIGAAILVLVGVLGFPLLFDTEPRPVAGDIPIEIPSRGDALPLATVEMDVVSEEGAASERSAESAVSARESLGAREEVVESAADESAGKSVAQPAPVEREKIQNTENDNRAKVAKAAKEAKQAKEAQAAKDAQVAAAAKAKSEAAESARARSLLESKQPAGSERYVVQVGAFAEAGSARSTRLKLERAGLATYTHVAQTSAGRLIRVRVGPFTSRAEVDRAAAKVKALGLPARILTL